MNLVLDTNAYSDWRRTGRWAENLALADRVILPSIVLGELEYGFIRGGRTAANRSALAEFLREPQVEVAPVTHATGRIYAELLLYLRGKGRPIPTNDIWIAAQAKEVNGELAARDGHFSELPMVMLAREIH